MPKNLDGSARGNFDNLNVDENGTVKGDLTVSGRIIGSLTTSATTSQNYVASAASDQFQAQSGTFDLKSNTAPNPLFRFKGSTGITTASVLQAGRTENEFTDPVAVEYTSQKNTGTGVGSNAGAGLKAETDTGGTVELVAYNTNHSTKPRRGVLRTANMNGFDIDLDSAPPGADIRLRVNGADRLYLGPTGLTTSLPLTLPSLSITGGTAGALTVTGGLGVSSNTSIGGNLTTTGTFSSNTVATNALSVVGNGTFGGTDETTGVNTGAVQTNGGIYSAKTIMGNEGFIIPYGKGLRTLPTGRATRYIDVQLNRAGGLAGDCTYLYTPGTDTFSSSADDTDFVLAVNRNGLKIKGTTSSTSTSTGSIVTGGGLGVNENIFAGGTISAGNSTDTVNVPTNTTASIWTPGSILAAKSIRSNASYIIDYGQYIRTPSYAGYKSTSILSVQYGLTGGFTSMDATYIYTPGTTAGASNTTDDFALGISKLGIKLNPNITTDSTSTTTGSIITAGGMGVGKNLYVGGTLVANSITYGNYSAGTFSVIDSTNSFAVGQGAFKVTTGGASIAGNLYVGGTLNVTGGVTYSTTNAPTFSVTSTAPSNTFSVLSPAVSVSPTTGAATIAGGLAANSESYFKTAIHAVPATTQGFAGMITHKNASTHPTNPVTGDQWYCGSGAGGLWNSFSIYPTGGTTIDKFNFISSENGSTYIRRIAQKRSVVPANGTTLVLSINDGPIIVVGNGTAGSATSIKLPSALELCIDANISPTISGNASTPELKYPGIEYTIYNNTSNNASISILDYGGNLLDTLTTSNSSTKLLLNDTSTAAGTWLVTNKKSGNFSATGVSTTYVPSTHKFTNIGSAGSGSGTTNTFFHNPNMVTSEEAGIVVGKNQVSTESAQLTYTNNLVGSRVVKVGFYGGKNLTIRENGDVDIEGTLRVGANSGLQIGTGPLVKYESGNLNSRIILTRSPYNSSNYWAVESSVYSYWVRWGEMVTWTFDIRFSYNIELHSRYIVLVGSPPYWPRVYASNVLDWWSNLYSEIYGYPKPYQATWDVQAGTYTGNTVTFPGVAFFAGNLQVMSREFVTTDQRVCGTLHYITDTTYHTETLNYAGLTATEGSGGGGAPGGDGGTTKQ